VSNQKKKCLIVVYSYHHKNTQKVAETIAKVLDAEVKAPNELSQEVLKTYDLIGFGAGIDSGKHYSELLNFADELKTVEGKPSFIFSTSAVQGDKKVYKDHTCLREKLRSKGYVVLDEFSCKGFNTNSFLKYFGGMNKEHPDENDLLMAEAFAKGLLTKAEASISREE
jgi:flavodoxin